MSQAGPEVPTRPSENLASRTTEGIAADPQDEIETDTLTERAVRMQVSSGRKNDEMLMKEGVIAKIVTAAYKEGTETTTDLDQDPDPDHDHDLHLHDGDHQDETIERAAANLSLVRRVQKKTEKRRARRGKRSPHLRCLQNP